MEMIATGCDTPDIKLRACATLSDSLEVYETDHLTVKTDRISISLLEKLWLVQDQHPK